MTLCLAFLDRNASGRHWPKKGNVAQHLSDRILLAAPDQPNRAGSAGDTRPGAAVGGALLPPGGHPRGVPLSTALTPPSPPGQTGTAAFLGKAG